ncbi:hypothetical protein, partial [Acetobacter tropicalis]|uniref:hypothetical protein n=1 Tax=Acetobacter tropicalis TaxID=104102 RepID=UPI0005F07A80
RDLFSKKQTFLYRKNAKTIKGNKNKKYGKIHTETAKDARKESKVLLKILSKFLKKPLFANI